MSVAIRVRQVLAWLNGEDGCPACEAGLIECEAGHHVCKSCGVVVDYAKGGWLYPGEHELRRLPGVAGRPWDRSHRRPAA